MTRMAGDCTSMAPLSRLTVEAGNVSYHHEPDLFPFLRLLDDFVLGIDAGKARWLASYDGVHCQELMDGLHEASRTRSWVQLPSHESV